MIYILAQGKGSRWGLVNDNQIPVPHPIIVPCDYKQLLPINGEPNILRTCRMLEEMGRMDFVVIAEEAMFANIDFCDKLLTTLEKPGNILDGICQLLHNVTENSIFLLGDVIFSKDALHKIVNHQGTNYTLFGRNTPNFKTKKVAKEIFAVSVNSEFVPLVRIQLKHRKKLGTKLWSWKTSDLFSGKWEEINDWTDDVDSPEEYELFFSILEECAVND